MRFVLPLIVVASMSSACVIVTEPSYARVVPGDAGSQEASGKYGPEPGDSILQLGGAISSQTTDTGVGGDSTTTNVALQGGIGWFQSEWLEIGGQVFGQLTLPDSGSDTVLISLTPYANANFQVAPRLWLYTGPHAGLSYFDFNSDTAVALAYGLHGGARVWIDPRTSVFGELRYTHSTFEINTIDIDSDVIELLFGFNLVF